MIGDTDWNEKGVYGDDWRMPESGELFKRFGVEVQWLSLTGNLLVLCIRDGPQVGGKISR